jgi:hypothetical protein
LAPRKLDKSEWRAFCDHLSKALLGSDSEAVNASLSVGEEVAAEWVPLLGFAYDPRSDSFDIALGGLEHRVRKPETLYVDEGPSGIAALEVIDGGGLRHRLRLDRPLKPTVRRRLRTKPAGRH